MDDAEFFPRATESPTPDRTPDPEARGRNRLAPPQFEVPPTIQCGVNFRVGDPTRTCREIKRIRDVLGGIPQVAFVSASDNFVVLSARIKSVLRRLQIPGEKYEWPSEEVYLKPFHNSPQAKFQPLDDTCVEERIKQAWRNEAARTRSENDVVVHLFVYLTLEAGQTVPTVRTTGGSSAARPTASIHRGTAASFARALSAIDRHNILPGVSQITAPLARQTLARDLSRNPSRLPPDGEEISIPTNPSYRQAESIDRQRQELELSDSL
ncbi:hypothetical protein BGZ73_001869, partial [Actinomortierella ambigua]